MDDETRRIYRLLSGGKLSGPESEEILERVLAAVAREKPRPVRALYPWTAAVLAAAAALLLVFLPPAPQRNARVPYRGMVSRPGRLQLTCTPGTLSACPSSSTLGISVTGDDSFGEHLHGFLSAYAEPLTPGVEPVFYFSKEDTSPKLPGAATVRPIASRAGRYRIHALLADRPLTRSELLDASAGRAAANIQVRAKLRREVVVTQ